VLVGEITRAPKSPPSNTTSSGPEVHPSPEEILARLGEASTTDDRVPELLAPQDLANLESGNTDASSGVDDPTSSDTAQQPEETEADTKSIADEVPEFSFDITGDFAVDSAIAVA